MALTSLDFTYRLCRLKVIVQSFLWFKQTSLTASKNLKIFLSRFEPWTFKSASQLAANSATLTP
jgi:hypothetical protein